MANESMPGTDVSRKPAWLKMKIPGGENYARVDAIIKTRSLHTVCESAHCPNIGECWDRGTATFMILGDICTRACGFCAVKTGRPTGLDLDEPERVADAVKSMNLRHAVITSVNRDELPDGGASVWRMTIEAVRRVNPKTQVEVLIPDLLGNWDALGEIISAKPEILAHNLETVPRLTRTVRSRAKFERSVELLARSVNAGMRTKTGLMLGIGETETEIRETLRLAAETGLQIVTLGQYLRPSRKHLPVHRWVTPEEFARWKTEGEALGIRHVESGPLVRSSYHADEHAAVAIG